MIVLLVTAAVMPFSAAFLVQGALLVILVMAGFVALIRALIT